MPTALVALAVVLEKGLVVLVELGPRHVLDAMCDRVEDRERERCGEEERRRLRVAEDAWRVSFEPLALTHA